jgi:thiamine kinase-like enzyme
LIHCDFKPDNFRFDKEGNMYWIDFESIQFFDIEYEMSQFVIPEFMVTNCHSFLSKYKEGLNIEIDCDRLEFYKLARCLSQIYSCSISLRKYGADCNLLQSVINSNLVTLNDMLCN